MTSVGDLERSVEPLDSVQLGIACPDILRAFDHSAEIVFPEAGEARLVFVGLRAPGDDMIRLQKEMVVR